MDSVPVSPVLSGVCDVTTMHVSRCRFCSCQSCAVSVMSQGCMHLVADSVPVEHVLSDVCDVRDHGVRTVLQQCMCLVADSVPVKHDLSGVCDVTMMLHILLQ